jgi:hypothetical protein
LVGNLYATSDLPGAGRAIQRTVRAIGLGAAFLSCLVAGPVLGNDFLKNLPAGSWYQAPSTKMRAVCASETAFPTIRAVGGCAMVMGAWSGGAFDPGRKRLMIWGGGHMDYWGNEVYAFDAETLKWIRLTDPTPMSQEKASADPLPEGAPIARHTYDGLAFLGAADRLFAYGGSMAGNGYGTSATWTFDPAAGKWEERKPSGNENRPATNCCNFSGESDPATGKVFMRDPNWLCAYDPAANAWTHVKAWTHTWSSGKAVIDTRRHLYFTIGSGEFLAYDIAAGKDVSADWKTTGGDSIVNGYGIGAAYDPVSDRIVAWAGKGVYVLDLGTRIWSVQGHSGGPAGQLEFGTYGRFRYVPGDNVFVLANGVDEDVWFYKLTAGGGTGLRERAVRKASKPTEEAMDPDGSLRTADGRAHDSRRRKYSDAGPRYNPRFKTSPR